MSYTEEYRELIDNAEEAIRALLEESAEESWIALRTGLREIGEAISAEETLDEVRATQARLRESREEFERRREGIRQQEQTLLHPPDHIFREWDERRERKRWWRQRPRAYKEGLIIEAIGDDQLRPDAVVARMEDLLGWTGNSGLWSSVDSLLRRLLASGQLDRVKTPVGGREVWHYFRRRGLDGPIADLERAWNDDSEAVA
ncbi:MAG: hypothetical protein ACTHMY_18010 [Solirubrobacteraceae bacterium]